MATGVFGKSFALTSALTAGGSRLFLASDADRVLPPMVYGLYDPVSGNRESVRVSTYTNTSVNITRGYDYTTATTFAAGSVFYAVEAVATGLTTIFTTSGTFRVYAGKKYLIGLIGGGGSGGSRSSDGGSGGGGGGAVLVGIYEPSANGTLTITVGAGGVGPNTSGSGQSGGNTTVVRTVDNLSLTAGGGSGGSSTTLNNSAAGGAGGTPSVSGDNFTVLISENGSGGGSYGSSVVGSGLYGGNANGDTGGGGGGCGGGDISAGQPGGIVARSGPVAMFPISLVAVGGRPAPGQVGIDAPYFGNGGSGIRRTSSTRPGGNGSQGIVAIQEIA